MTVAGGVEGGGEVEPGVRGRAEGDGAAAVARGLGRVAELEEAHSEVGVDGGGGGGGAEGGAEGADGRAQRVGAVEAEGVRHAGAGLSGGEGLEEALGEEEGPGRRRRGGREGLQLGGEVRRDGLMRDR